MTARAWPPRGTFDPSPSPPSRRESGPTWRDRAVCAETDPEVFFPEKGQPNDDAKRICGGCEARAECLEFAIETVQEFGVWGGWSENERRAYRRRMRAVA